jgi:hypothetical protein
MGKLFVGYFSPLRRQMMQRRLESIKKGMTKAEYPIFAASPQGGRHKR